jgi:zinc/manganese transport system substrate-binding protein
MRLARISHTVVAAFLSCLALAANAEPIKVVASFSILADLARNTGSDRVEVVSVIGPEADPHGYEPKPSDARKLAGATVLIVNGLGLDGWIDRLAQASGFHGVRVVASAGTAPILHGQNADPHAWQSVPNAIAYVGNIADGLIKAQPADADALRMTAESYTVKLRALNEEVRRLLEPIPAERRRVVVPHRAFDYFGREYGLEFLAPLGTNADAEATGSEMASLVAALRRGETRAIFSEHLEDRRIVDGIAAEAGLPVSGELYSDCLSAPGGPAATYIDLIRHNAKIIAQTLMPAAALHP